MMGANEQVQVEGEPVVISPPMRFQVLTASACVWMGVRN